ncbi:hypothetical protein D9M72_615480 [compost metagenome]
MNGTDQDVDLVALDEAVGVVRSLGGIGLVVDLEVFDVLAGQFAALLFDVKLEAVFDGFAKCGISAAIGQHKADFHRGRGCAGCKNKRRSECGAGKYMFHLSSPWFSGMNCWC